MRLCRVKFGFSVKTFNQLAEGTSPAQERDRRTGRRLAPPRIRRVIIISCDPSRTLPGCCSTWPALSSEPPNRQITPAGLERCAFFFAAQSFFPSAVLHHFTIRCQNIKPCSLRTVLRQLDFNCQSWVCWFFFMYRFGTSLFGAPTFRRPCGLCQAARDVDYRWKTMCRFCFECVCSICIYLYGQVGTALIRLN